MADEVPRVKGFRDFMRRAGWASLAILFVVTGLGVGVYAFWQGTHEDKTNQTQSNQLKGTPLTGFTPISKIDKFSIKETKKGNGQTAKKGNQVTVHYIGALASTGIVFDTSFDLGQPATFELSPGKVIDGFYKGLLGMKIGGERQIFIPAAEAYGANPPQNSGIPANADLVFDVLLLGVQ